MSLVAHGNSLKPTVKWNAFRSIHYRHCKNVRTQHSRYVLLLGHGRYTRVKVHAVRLQIYSALPCSFNNRTLQFHNHKSVHYNQCVSLCVQKNYSKNRLQKFASLALFLFEKFFFSTASLVVPFRLQVPLLELREYSLRQVKWKTLTPAGLQYPTQARRDSHENGNARVLQFSNMIPGPT